MAGGSGGALGAHGESCEHLGKVAADLGAISVAGAPVETLSRDYFGEIALLLGSDRAATVIATTDLRCYALTPWDFRALVEGNPSIAWKVMQSMAARMP